jgi:hypothetical protein
MENMSEFIHIFRILRETQHALIKITQLMEDLPLHRYISSERLARVFQDGSEIFREVVEQLQIFTRAHIGYSERLILSHPATRKLHSNGAWYPNQCSASKRLRLAIAAVFAIDALFVSCKASRRASFARISSKEISDSLDGSWMDENEAAGEEKRVPEGTERHGAAKFRPPAADRQADTGDGWDANETRNDRLLPPGQEPPSRAWNGFPLPVRVTTLPSRDAHRDTQSAFIPGSKVRRTEEKSREIRK